MLAVDSIPALAAILRGRTTTEQRLIGIDGFEGSGKSTCGLALSSSLECPRLSLDCYLDESKSDEDYLARLRVDNLRRELKQQIDAFPFTIVEGVCLLDVMTRIGVAVGSHVYVRARSEQGNWHRGIDLEDYESDAASAAGEGWLTRQVLQYHAKRRPHEIADVLFERLSF